jgi:hypothetical protein
MNIRHVLSLFTAVALSACGGSGGGGGAPGVTVPPPPSGGVGLTIDAANAKPAARVAYGATVDSMDSGDVVGGSTIAMSPGGGLAKPVLDNQVSGAIQRYMQKDPVGPLVSPCFGGVGTETTTGNVVDPFTLTAGDTLNVDYVDCANEFGETLNGRMEMTITVFSGDIIFTGLFLLTADVRLANFEVTTAADSIVSNGDASVSIDTFGTPTILLSISGDLLATESLSSTEVITTYASSQSVHTLTEMYTLSTSGTVDSSRISGFIAYSTAETFQGVGAAYPFFGQLLISGDGPATIRLIAQSDTMVSIEVDTDGDGVADSTELTTWDDIAL